ncbi:protein phosphatase CheZ [Aliiglaciecola sp. CAU 1673]|uniref:protein phosphatase CheZ n=1 Tax=Aliiglaciecola sp. CAU 1673 TaxID=3032595 RepID=UPI0023DBF262|nr:protein phosphatase CheZ [Aliiglaciecola sp. CAU 1673]MDF2177474.1 protein phosphatase CheZ [Aliiglaciecola sp. CAU 1673]
MTESIQAPMSLEDARQLVTLLEKEDYQGATALLEAISLQDSMELFAQVGKLTRQLHDSLNSFQIDDRLADLTKEDLPDAKSRLNYVIDTTEDAANRTMDAVETSMPIAERLNARIHDVLPEWKKLMERDIQLGDFKSLCHNVDSLLKEADADSAKLNQLLTEILMAQGYQDLTGQVIRKVIVLVKEVEDSLVNMLTMFGDSDVSEKTKKAKKKPDKVEAEGPIIDASNRDDVVTGQDDVDDLLSSLGF